MSPYPRFARILDERLYKLDRSSSWLAQRLRVNPSTVSRWINHETRPGTVETVVRIADILGIHKPEERQELLVAAGYGVKGAAAVDTSLEAPDPVPPVGAEEHPTPAASPSRSALAPGSVMPFAPNPLFIGREQVLSRLKEILESGARQAGKVPTAAVTGLGGIGKSQIACEFVHRHGHHYSGGVFWVSFNDPDTIGAKIAACGGADALGLAPDFHTRPIEEQVRMVQSLWLLPSRRLLIFDNCEEPEQLVRWRPTSGGSSVLLTARRGEWERTLGVSVIEVDTLDRRKSVELLDRYREGLDEDVQNAIAAELGDLPLALHLAGSYLQRYRRSVDGMAYLQQLRDPLLVHHRSLVGNGHSPTGHEQSVGRTFALSLEQLETERESDRLALHVLFIAARFAPGESIPFHLLAAAADTIVATESVDAQGIDDALRRLVVLGLVQLDGDTRVRLHPLVCDYLVAFDLESWMRAGQGVGQTLLEESQRINRSGSVRELLAWQVHLRWMAGSLKESDVILGARLRNELGEHLYLIGDFAGARVQFEAYLTSLQANSEIGQAELAQAYHNLGALLPDLGDLDNGESMLRNALRIREEALGTNDQLVAQTLNEIARIAYLKHDGETASRHLQHALNICRHALGEDHPRTAYYANNLGMCLLEVLNDPKTASLHLSNALEIRQRSLGDDHPSTALSHNNLGYLFQATEEYEKARYHHLTALKIRQRILGDDHPDIAQSLSNLGLLELQTADLPRSLAYLNQALNLYRRSVGEDHWRTAFCLNSLGEAYMRSGDFEAALHAWQRAHAIRLSVFGAEHPDTAASYANLERARQAVEREK